MQIRGLDEFYTQNYTVRFLNCLRQFWRTERDFSCFGCPKKENIFLFLDGCSARYEDSQGNVWVANSGDLVYTPVNSEYKVSFYDFENERSGTVGINFFLFDEYGTPFSFSACPVVFANNQIAKMLCLEAERLTYAPIQILAKYNVILYNVISELATQQTKGATERTNFYLLQNGLEYLSTHVAENPNVNEIAKKCGISPSYLRKLFQVHLGKSPMEYREDLRLERACQYLRYGEIPVCEIAEVLGFVDSAYFIKRFKQKLGITPLQYRKRNKL